MKATGTQLTILLIYVDDIVLTGNNLQEITSVKSILDQPFKIKDLGTLKFFLAWRLQGLLHDLFFHSENML